MKKFLRNPFNALFPLIVVFAVLLAMSVAPKRAEAQTIYQLPAAGLAQLTGANGAQIVKPTYAATMTISANNMVQEIAGDSSTSATCAINVGTGGQWGQLLIVIYADTGGVTYTTGANFKTATATVNPTTGKKIVVVYISDGTYFREVTRCTAA